MSRPVEPRIIGEHIAPGPGREEAAEILMVASRVRG